MSLLIPAILAKSQKEFVNKFKLVAPFCHRIQVDIMDGSFVPNKTIAVSQIPHFKHPIKLELHLMIKNPLSVFELEKHPAVSTVIFHYESVGNPAEILNAMPRQIIRGVALNPETPAAVLQPIIKDVDLVLLMSVQPGFDGQEFIPDTIAKIAEVKNMRPGIIIEVDGGINTHNAADVANMGADQVVVGSHLFESKNIKHSMKELMLELGDIEGVGI